MDTRSSRTLAIVLLFSTLAYCAATGFPGTVFAEAMPRGLRILDWIVTTFGTAPFGKLGATLLFAVLGVTLTYLSYRYEAERSPAMSSDQGGPVFNLTAIRSLIFGGKRQTHHPAMTMSELDHPFDTGGDATPKPGWSLVLRSPYESWDDATSWLGGVPVAPPGFAWPRDKDGSPLTFLTQIDLASIKPEPSTGTRPAGLPANGSILIFVGRSYACRVLTEAEMRDAGPLAPPADLPALSRHGFFGNGQMLVRWPVSPIAFFDKGEEGRPGAFPDRFSKIETWIANWGIAAIEAEIALACLNMELRNAHSFYETQTLLLRDARSLPMGEGYTLNSRHYAQILEDAPDLVSALTLWHQRALAQLSEQPVDRRALAAIFEQRMKFVAKLTGNYRPKFILPGNPQEVWRKLTSPYQSADAQRFFQALPSAYRPFIEAYITDWRGHRLFGVEPPFPNNSEDLRGQSCLISIAADALLNTCSEHEYGMSVWCTNEDIVRGRYDRGQFVRHCAV